MPADSLRDSRSLSYSPPARQRRPARSPPSRRSVLNRSMYFSIDYNFQPLPLLILISIHSATRKSRSRSPDSRRRKWVNNLPFLFSGHSYLTLTGLDHLRITWMRNVTSCNGELFFFFTNSRGRSIKTWFFVTHPKREDLFLPLLWCN